METAARANQLAASLAQPRAATRAGALDLRHCLAPPRGFRLALISSLHGGFYSGFTLKTQTAARP